MRAEILPGQIAARHSAQASVRKMDRTVGVSGIDVVREGGKLVAVGYGNFRA